MLRSIPNERYKLIRKGTKGKDELVDQILDDPDDPVYVDASEIYKTPLKRAYVEACLTATNDTNKISKLLEMDKQVLDLYSKIYYDIQGFTVLDKLSVIDNETDNFAKSLKNWALSQGLEFLSWRLGLVSEVKPVEGLEALFSDCYYKSKEAFFNHNASEASKEGAKWVKLSMQMARILKAWKAASDDDTRREILMTLQELDPNFENPDDLNLPDSNDTNK